MLYTNLRAIFRVLIRVICRYRVYGLNRVPATGPLLIVANHLSWYDPILLGIVLQRRVWFFTKAEIFRWPLIGKLCELTGQIPVRRGESDRAALEKGLAYLKEGRALCIYPEGTVERKAAMIPARSGVAMLAMRSEATVLPVALEGTRRLFSRVTVKIGEPYIPVLPSDVPRKVGLQRITREIMFRIANMLPPEQRGVYAREETALPASVEDRSREYEML